MTKRKEAENPQGLCVYVSMYTYKGTNISHLGKGKIIFKMPFLGGYVSSLEGIYYVYIYIYCI